MTVPAVPDNGPALLRIEKPVAEWRVLAHALAVGLGAVHLRDRGGRGGATASVLDHFCRLLSQVTRHDGRDETSAATMILTRAQWQSLEGAARDVATVVTGPAARHWYRRDLPTAIPHLVAFADELARANQDAGATVWLIRCAERRASGAP